MKTVVLGIGLLVVFYSCKHQCADFNQDALNWIPYHNNDTITFPYINLALYWKGINYSFYDSQSDSINNFEINGRRWILSEFIPVEDEIQATRFEESPC